MITRSTAIAFTLAVSLGAFAAPADAQRRQRVIEVFGNDRCPEGGTDEIVICKRLGEDERYRIPTQFREPTAADATTQEARVNEMVAAGRTGADSCSPVGPTGFTGCFVQQVRNNRAEKRDERRARQAEPR